MIKPILRLVVLSLLICEHAFAQTASILPNAKSVFLDRNGNPLTSGTVTFYIPNTTTLKTTWQDSAETIPNANPVVLDAAGSAIIYGEGSYRQIVKDRNGNIIWDQVTTSYVPAVTTTTSGDKNYVGTVLSWAGINPPTNYLFAYGQEVNRTTYAELFSTITSTQNVNCTTGSTTLSNVSDVYQTWIGMPIESSCLPSGTTVTGRTTTTLTVSNNAISTGTTIATLFFWGNGNGSSTFNIPDLRGYALIGRNNMGNTPSARIASGGDSIGGTLGTETKSLAITNIPAHNHTFSGTTSSDGAHTHAGVVTALQAGVILQLGSNFNMTTGSTGSAGAHTHTFSGTTSSVGSGTAFSIMQPSININYVIKVTADSN